MEDQPIELQKETVFAGFGVRFVASIIDIVVILVPILYLSLYLFDLEFNITDYIYDVSGDARVDIILMFSVAIIVIFCWVKWSGATPGKKILGIRVVDMETKGDIDLNQSITRYVAYLLSALTLFIGFFMIAFRKDKRGLHDLLSDTCVIYVESPEE